MLLVGVVVVVVEMRRIRNVLTCEEKRMGVDKRKERNRRLLTKKTNSSEKKMKSKNIGKKQ